MERLRRALRGVDREGKPALPVGEALHPVTLAAVVVLVVNDWLLKPRLHGPIGSAITGKLSDIAGLVFAPLVLSASIGLVLALCYRLGRLGARPDARNDPRLTHRRLVACIALTGACFAAVKLSPAVAHAFVQTLALVGFHAHVALDRTDLLALPALTIAYFIGRDELRRAKRFRPVTER